MVQYNNILASSNIILILNNIGNKQFFLFISHKADNFKSQEIVTEDQCFYKMLSHDFAHEMNQIYANRKCNHETTMFVSFNFFKALQQEIKF